VSRAAANRKPGRSPSASAATHRKAFNTEAQFFVVAANQAGEVSQGSAHALNLFGHLQRLPPDNDTHLLHSTLPSQSGANIHIGPRGRGL
jgi:hypothetical protein